MDTRNCSPGGRSGNAAICFVAALTVWIVSWVPAQAFEMIGLDHFGINVRNLEASTKWYSDVLGFAVLHKWSGVTMVGRGNIKVGLFENPTAPTVDDQENKIVIFHVAILVDGDKFDAALAELKSKGIAIQGPEDTGIAFSFFIRDPDGHQIEMTSYHAAASPPPAPLATRNRP
jgi:catechol-2,3-dioxygenase